MSTSPTAPLITRRAGLLSLAALAPAALLAACSSDDASTPSASGSGPAGSTGTVTVSTESADDESALIAAYDAVIASLGDTDDSVRAVLADIRDQHAAHRDALGGAADVDSPAAGGGLGPQLADLVDRERRASRARIRASLDADADLARTLTFIAASEAAHVPALAELQP